MADVKIPSKLHLMSPSFQKNWYKKHNMTPPDENLEGPSAAAAKRIKVAPRKVIAAKPDSLRALNAARQQAYLAKGGRQPIGSMGSGGSNVMAGAGQSTIKDLKASIKAGFNPKVSLDPYESERAKKIGPRSLKMKKEEVQIDEALSPERKRMFDLKLKLIKKVANKKSYTKPSKVDEPRSSLNPSRDLKLQPKSLPTVAVGHYKEEVQIDEVTGYEGVKDRTDMIKRAAVMGRMGKNVFLARVKARAAEMKKQKAMKEEVQDQADVGEYDYEGDMAKSQLRSILANAKRMHDMLEENTNLPEWVQSKITLAEDYILTAANYMEGEMNEELIRQEESIFEAMKKMEMDDEEDEMDDEDEMEDDEEETKMKAKRTNESAKDWKKAFSNVAQKNLQKDVGKIRSKVGRLNYIGMQPKVDTTPKVTATMTKKGTYSEEFEQTDEAVRIVDVERGLPRKSNVRVRPGSFSASDFRDRLAQAAKERRKITGEPGVKGFNKPIGFSPTKYMDTSYVRAIKKEEVVTEAEGTVAVTPKEKALAAHHGDKSKITYGDVIKARLKSVAAKAMNKGK